MSVGLVLPGSGQRCCGPVGLRAQERQPWERKPSGAAWMRMVGLGQGKQRGSLLCARAVASSSNCSEQSMSFYQLLGIPESGSLLEIKQAYKQMARKYHPDVSPPDLAEEHTKRFIRVQEAYETLSDPTRRAMYDRDLARGLQFAFSARRRPDLDMEERDGWKSLWKSQVADLKRRSVEKNSDGNLSWGARMRRRQREAYAE
ncbi:Chaperone protein dnaJ 20 [Nymphaea thermarum]|nr:Chaperone protein dnaJ 20 [Nymphaea thermarum]